MTSLSEIYSAILSYAQGINQQTQQVITAQSAAASNLTSIVQSTGISGTVGTSQVVSSAGAAIWPSSQVNPIPGMSLLATYTSSIASSGTSVIDISLPSGYVNYEFFVFRGTPASSDQFDFKYISSSGFVISSNYVTNTVAFTSAGFAGSAQPTTNFLLSANLVAPSSVVANGINGSLTIYGPTVSSYGSIAFTKGDFSNFQITQNGLVQAIANGFVNGFLSPLSGVRFLWLNGAAWGSSATIKLYGFN